MTAPHSTGCTPVSPLCLYMAFLGSELLQPLNFVLRPKEAPVTRSFKVPCGCPSWFWHLSLSQDLCRPEEKMLGSLPFGFNDSWVYEDLEDLNWNESSSFDPLATHFQVGVQ